MSHRVRRSAILVGFTVLAVSLAGGLAAQPAAKAAPDPSRQIQAADDARIAALRKPDVASLEKLYADDYRVIGQNGAVRTKRDQVAAFRSGMVRYTAFQLVEREVKVAGPTLGVVWSRERSTIAVNGQGSTTDLRYTRVYVQRNGQWQLLAAHASVVAPAPPAGGG